MLTTFSRRALLASLFFASTAASGTHLVAQSPPPGLIPTVRAAVAKQDFKGAERLIADYKTAKGTTPEMLEAYSWLGRGALAAKQFEQATTYANQTYAMVKDVLKVRGLDDEPRLPIALGAAIEVLGQARAATGARSEAVAYLRKELRAYERTSMNKRIQKNINLLSLEGTPAPALDLSESLGPKALGLDSVKGKVAIVFFWAHWCPDCKNQGPALSNLLKKYESQGLTVIAPTQRYGYVAGGRDAGRDEERQYIAEIKKTHYGFLDDRVITLAEANHQRYGVSTTPTLVVLDRAGIVRSYHPGNMTETELDALVQKLLADKTGTAQ